MMVFNLSEFLSYHSSPFRNTLPNLFDLILLSIIIKIIIFFISKKIVNFICVIGYIVVIMLFTKNFNTVYKSIIFSIILIQMNLIYYFKSISKRFSCNETLYIYYLIFVSVFFGKKSSLKQLVLQF